MKQEIFWKNLLDIGLDQICRKRLVKRLIFDDSNEIEIRLPCRRSFSTLWNISGV